MLATMLFAVPVSAQSYGNSGSTAAGPGTGAALRYDSRTPDDRSGGWGIWGLVGLLGLFGLARRNWGDVYKERLPRSGTEPVQDADVPTITGAPPSTTPPQPRA